jgi:hypothetical protein
MWIPLLVFFFSNNLEVNESLKTITKGISLICRISKRYKHNLPLSYIKNKYLWKPKKSSHEQKIALSYMW